MGSTASASSHVEEHPAEADDILDDLFHGCALAAYVELAIACRGVPDRDATRLLAYRYYEESLRKKNETR